MRFLRSAKAVVFAGILLLSALWPPSDAIAAPTFVTMAGGWDQTCGITPSGGLQCWGVGVPTPTDVPGLESGVGSFDVGTSQACAVTQAGSLKCWGFNGFGQLGDGTNTDRPTPVDVVGLGSNVIDVVAGDFHTCALTGGGAVRCWGWNVNGELGMGAIGGLSTVPVEVVGLSNGVGDLVAGRRFTCAMMNAGGIKCWGENNFGQLGDGTTASSAVPLDVVVLSEPPVSLGVGRFHTCVLTTGGGIRCWGGNGSGELGDGTTTNRLTPVDVIGLGGPVAQLAVARYHTCALLTSGTVKCWGRNSFGALGIGSIIATSVPTSVLGLGTDVASVMPGDFHMCVRTASLATKCWGWNEGGQLGNGSFVNRSRARDMDDPDADDDADTVLNAADDDDDGDGCTDAQERGAVAASGGLREQHSVWDLMDVPTGSALQRDRVVGAADIAAITARVGATDSGPGSFDRNSNPLSTPNLAVAPSGVRANYHPAYDRGGSDTAASVWNLLPPNGAIGAMEQVATVAQFGHRCE